MGFVAQIPLARLRPRSFWRNARGIAPEEVHRIERWLATAARWAKGRGVIVKSRRGLTSFGQHLADDEIRYLHAIVRQALVARP